MIPINILFVNRKEENIVTLKTLLKCNDIGMFFSKSSNDALKLIWEKQIAIVLVDDETPEINSFELAAILQSNPRTRDILIVFFKLLGKRNQSAVF